ncbi:glucosylglycerol-phosphate synthase [Nevskia sp.]|uniref:glucosylglycerol-phosphate synthase n=1 Tax=Nevskia sp. TaxID=1929292 RepID=UPI0025EF462E|nr:glucosylglycerol-phosphate synthase [Nevskia sp.]
MLLATDLDGTFLGGHAADRQQLYQLVARHPDIKLAYVTGRGLETVLPLLADPSLPQPEYIVCDVGATVVDGVSLQAIQPLQSEIAARWPGEQPVAAAFAPFTALARQGTPQQRRCSYFCDAEVITDEMHAAAAQLDCELLFSAAKYLDVLPKGVNKGSTLVALVAHLGLDPEDVLVAGDTLNDLSMFEQGFKGVAVGESEPGLLARTERMGRVFHAQRPGCGGILEALSHFGFLGSRSIESMRDVVQKPGESDLVVVYHRLPYEEAIEDGRIVRRRHASPNGIIPTLMSLFSTGQRGAWVAWSTLDPKTGPFEARTPVDVERYPNLVAARVALSRSDVDVFYKRFSKDAFWPTLHTFWERASFREDHWKIYVEVNRKFAEAAAREAAHGATVWIHDYNLWLVPAFLRELRSDVRIAFFHHTYFPSADVFNVLPWRRAIVGSLLQCDYIGFHIPRQVENFIDVARGVMPVKALDWENCAPRYLTYGCAVGLDSMTSVIEVHGRVVRLGAHPVGLDVARVEQLIAKPTVLDQIAALRRQLRGQRLILSVERLDYTKGTLEKLQAFEALLEARPELHGSLTMIAVCVPAAQEIKAYAGLQTQIEQAVGRINGRYGRVDWQPLQYWFRSLPFEDLMAYYAVASVMWITPLRDGLNLVAKEFAAAQGLTGGNGVLVLSEFAGAAAELKGALLTNPHDPADLLAVISQAIDMDASEAQDRLKSLYDIVRHNDIRRWSADFLAAVDGPTLSETSAPARSSAA